MTDIASLLDRAGVPYDVSGRGKNRPGWLNTRCPTCQKFPYLGINLSRVYGNCWNCGRADLAKAVTDLTGLGLAEVRRLLRELPRDGAEPEPHAGTLRLPPHLPYLLPIQRDYLRSRGFDPDALQRLWDLRGVGQLGGPVAWRILIPVYRDAKIVSWTSRNVTDREPRYRSARDGDSAVPIEECVYGIDYCRHAIILCEGPADVWRIGPGAAALMGLRLHPAQVRQVSKLPIRVVCFDNEPEAQLRARRLTRDLGCLDGRTVNVVLESAKDAGAASAAEIEELRRRYLE